MGILDFFSDEAGQRRRAALDEFGRDVGYYVPPELRSRLGLLASMNPVEGVSRSMQASERMTAPGRTPMQRVGDAGEMLSEVAGVVAPVAVAGRAGLTGAQAAQEAFMGASFAPRSASEAMARDILDLRAAGRADEVTEEMMAAADDQYMFANTPLPMDEASRMERAGEMGFGLEYPLYRGDTVDHPYYQALYDDAIYTSTDPRVSEDYAFSRGLISPLIGNRNNFAVDSSFDDFDADGFSEAITDAYDSGRSGVNFQSVADGDAFSKHGKVIADTNAFLDPANIRSRFARFDPAFAHLRNLSAGFGGLGLLGIAAGSQPAQGDGT